MEVAEQVELKVPKLRFREFKDAWTSAELENITNKITVGIATEVRPYVTSHIEVPLLRNQNIRAGYFDDSDMEYITSEFDEANRNKRVKSGDVLIVRTGSNTGNACVVPVKYENSQTFTTLIVRPKPLLCSEFLSLHINYKGISEIMRLSAGAGKPNLNAGFLKSYRILLPKEDEQQKIAGFLSAVDEKLQHLNRKKELLQQYKKGVMQKLFSQELRFKREDGSNYEDWEEKRLGDVCKKKSSNVAANMLETNEGPFPVFGASGFIKGLDFYNEESEYIAIVKDGAGVGRNFLCPKKSSVLGTLDILTSKGKNNVVFIYYLLQQFRFVKYVIGSTIPHIYFKDYSTGKVTVPSTEEQQKIADFLSSLDEKIDAVSAQIEKTQQFKKGLLQEMFV